MNIWGMILCIIFLYTIDTKYGEKNSDIVLRLFLVQEVLAIEHKGLKTTDHL